MIMAFSGLFLILFLIGHVSGNLLLFADDNGEAYNKYAAFMTTNTAIQVVRYITWISIVVHVIYSVVLTYNNKQARPVGYLKSSASANSTWISRNMMPIGIIVFIFLAIHLRTFLYEMKFGTIPMVTYAGTAEIKDLFSIVKEAFRQEWYVAFYVGSMVFLALHLFHGFQSTSQTVGFRHPKYNDFIKKFGYAFGVVVCLLFAIMPVFLYLKYA